MCRTVILVMAGAQLTVRMSSRMVAVVVVVVVVFSCFVSGGCTYYTWGDCGYVDG